MTTKPEIGGSPAPSESVGQWRWLYLAGCAVLLAVPAVSMQLTSEVNWGPGDFVSMAAMLAFLGLALEGAVRIGRSFSARALLMTGAAAMFLVVWAELAVGIVD